MSDRDYLQLFAYFVGANGEHAVHVRALLHAGFTVEPDPDTSKKSYVKNPATGETLGVIVGEPKAVIGWFKPTPPPVAAEVNGKIDKVAGIKMRGTGV